MVTVVFVCTANRWRSPMAEHLFKNLLEEKDKALAQKIKVLSAGVVLDKRIDELKKQGITIPEPIWGYRPMPCVIFYMAKRGIDAHDDKSKPLDWEMANMSNLIVGFTESHKDAVLTAFPYLKKDKIVTLTELSYPFGPGIMEIIKTEPSGLFPPCDFCIRDCDHWWTTEQVITEMEERLREAMDKILLRLGVITS